MVDLFLVSGLSGVRQDGSDDVTHVLYHHLISPNVLHRKQAPVVDGALAESHGFSPGNLSFIRFAASVKMCVI